MIRNSPVSEKGDLLIRAHEPARLTRGLSQEELYLITRELDTEERSEILQYATLPQLTFVGDMECWKGDRVESGGFLTWLETLVAAGAEKTMEWIEGIDFETLVACFQSLVQVVKPDWEYASDELLGDRQYFTLDERYHFSVPEQNIDTVKRTLEILYENHRGRYAALAESLVSENTDLIEEEAYRLREDRLAERGFPDVETARKVYRRMSVEEFEAFPKKGAAQPVAHESDSQPGHLVRWNQETLFLDEVLVLLRQDTPGVLESVQEELAWLANKVIAASGLDFSSEASIRRGVERSRQYVNIGLEHLTSSNYEAARQLLSERWLEPIFRRAATLIQEARDSVIHLLNTFWEKDCDLMFDSFEGSYANILRGFFEQIPLYYDTRFSDHLYHLRDFKTLDELNRTVRAVSQLETIHGWLLAEKPKGLRLALNAVRAFSSGCGFFSLLGTAFARKTLGLTQTLAPLTPRQAKKFYEKVFSVHGARSRISSDIRKGFVYGAFSEKEAALLLPLWGLIFDEMEAAFDGSAARDLDFRLKTVMWVKH